MLHTTYRAGAVAACGSSQADPVASGLFGGIKGGVGGPHEIIARHAVVGECGRSGADRNRTRNAGKLPSGHALPQFLRDVHGMLRVGLSQQDAEFLSSVAADHINLAQLLVK